MATRITHFFATKEDLLKAIEPAEQKRSLKYVLTGLLDTSALEVYQTVAAIPGLGTATHESAICGACYLVSDRHAAIINHKRPQNAGGVRYEVSQLGNPATITFQPGGLFGGTALLYGRVATVSEDPISKEIYRLFTSAIRKAFIKVKRDYIGPEAKVLWEAGMRLTQAVQSPREFDLTP